MPGMIAEVSDKMPPVAASWLLGALAAVAVGLACWRVRPLIFVLAPLAAAIAGAAALGLLRLDDVDAAWMAEQGRAAVLAAYGGWLLPLPAALIGFALSRGRRRLQEGRCASCRYDLTGNVSGVCPECGTWTGMAVGR